MHRACVSPLSRDFAFRMDMFNTVLNPIPVSGPGRKIMSCLFTARHAKYVYQRYVLEIAMTCSRRCTYLSGQTALFSPSLCVNFSQLRLFTGVFFSFCYSAWRRSKQDIPPRVVDVVGCYFNGEFLVEGSESRLVHLCRMTAVHVECKFLANMSQN